MEIYYHEVEQLRSIVKNIVRDEILLPSQNFLSRIVRPDDEICTRTKGSAKIQALLVYGITLLLWEEENKNNLCLWKLLSDLLERSQYQSLLWNVKIQTMTFTSNYLADENILEGEIFGSTKQEIFGFLLNPSTIDEIRHSFQFYIKRPKNPSRVQRHRGYRDKGSLGGDKSHLLARNYDQDEKLQKLHEERKSKLYTFSELHELYGL